MAHSSQHETGSPSEKPAEKLVCYCFDVTGREIEAAIRTKRLTSIQEIGRVTGAGRGCGTCWLDLEGLLARCAKGKG